MIRLVIAAALALCLLQLTSRYSLAAVTVPADLPALNVSVTRISDNRDGAPDSTGAIAGRANLSLTLTVTSSGLPTASAIRSIRITRAADENGRELPAMVGRTEYSINTMRTGSASTAQPLTGTVNLPGAPRRTRSLKILEGTIEMFVPETTNGSAIRILNIKNHSGPIQHPVLERNGIEFHFLGSQTSADAARASTAALSPTEATLVADSVGGYGVYFKDPSNKLLGAQLADGRGELLSGSGGTTNMIGRVNTGSTWSNNNSRASTRVPLNDDTQLFLFVAIPEAIKTVPFRIEDIVLP